MFLGDFQELINFFNKCFIRQKLANKQDSAYRKNRKADTKCTKNDFSIKIHSLHRIFQKLNRTCIGIDFGLDAYRNREFIGDVANHSPCKSRFFSWFDVIFPEVF